MASESARLLSSSFSSPCTSSSPDINARTQKCNKSTTASFAQNSHVGGLKQSHLPSLLSCFSQAEFEDLHSPLPRRPVRARHDPTFCGISATTSNNGPLFEETTVIEDEVGGQNLRLEHFPEIEELQGPNFPFVLEARWIDSAIKISRSVSRDAFFIALLEAIAEKAQPPISDFRVAAVGLGSSGRAFLGVNVEFPGLPLHHSIHAEQFMVANAIQHGEEKLEEVIVSQPPCGHCRQFLQELRHAGEIRVVIADGRAAEKSSLEHFLPHGFGPHNLLHEDFPLLLEPRHNHLTLSLDPIAQNALNENTNVATNLDLMKALALRMANSAYAPYSHSPAGVAIFTKGGKFYGGAYMESAAYNPSLPPLQSAIVAMICGGEGNLSGILSVVLVEKKGAFVQFTDTIAISLPKISSAASFQTFYAEDS